MKQKVILLLCIVGSMLMQACKHKDLCYDHNHNAQLTVVFDWSEAPEADPQSMWVCFYPKEEGEMKLFEVNSHTGGSMELPAGSYDIVCLNPDSEVLEYNNMEVFELFEALTVNGRLGISSVLPPSLEGVEGQRLTESPDRFWSDQLLDETFHRDEEDRVVTLTPTSPLRNVHVTIVNVDNLKYVHESNICGSLSGMSDGIFVALNRLRRTKAMLPFDMKSDQVSELTAEFKTFGYCEELRIGHQLVVYALLKDGKKYYYTFDVTNQVHAAGKNKDIYIRLDGLPLPTPIVNGNGFQPSLDDWEEIEEELQM